MCGRKGGREGENGRGRIGVGAPVWRIYRGTEREKGRRKGREERSLEEATMVRGGW